MGFVLQRFQFTLKYILRKQKPADLIPCAPHLEFFVALHNTNFEFIMLSLQLLFRIRMFHVEKHVLLLHICYCEFEYFTSKNTFYFCTFDIANSNVSRQKTYSASAHASLSPPVTDDTLPPPPHLQTMACWLALTLLTTLPVIPLKFQLFISCRINFVHWMLHTYRLTTS